MKRYQLFINNEWVDPKSNTWFETHDPFSGEAWAEIPRANAADVDLAVTAAHNAFEGPWSGMSASDRGMLLHKLGTLIERDAAHLAAIESRDNGKLSRDVLAQMKYMARYYYYYGGLADKIQGAVVPIDRPKVYNFIRYEPMGVVACITPWNSSLPLTTWKMAPALCAGNTVVCKPSEYTSASLFELARLFVEAGFPPGVFNIVTGFGGEVGDPLVRHPQVPRIAFTGGDEAGRKIYQAAADNLKRVSLELGGKSPNIVFDDADLDEAVKGVIAGIFSATGQTCVAGSRVLLQESIHDAFVERLAQITRNAKVGDPADPASEIGPVTTKPQFEKIRDYIDIAKKEGARCIAGGHVLDGPAYGAGQFIEPTIFVDVTNDMRIAQEEVFGPVLSVIKFKDEEDAIRIGNDIRFGLAAGVWTTSLHRAMLMSEKLKAGTVWINNYRSSSYTTPFGGVKHSGIGREGGIESVKEFMEAKSVWISTDLKMPSIFAGK
ncbi:MULTISPECIES: aldehyde dehydrogenase [unclassified Achromobacter]|uniref:aldehyde dehydrogenase n=1 Tax=unclassified Achromobacter TaxID=2626865 RepID=UPI000B51E299|nr:MULTISPECIES: aldehyde dehydrogenase [unclassified Achromobacter]OWT77169.1 carnitine dehydratase [Achromobacter sp. HZ28]OWT78050.1 carnitine dehydratase [Achromobacter sp. HZ34]